MNCRVVATYFGPRRNHGGSNTNSLTGEDAVRLLTELVEYETTISSGVEKDTIIVNHDFGHKRGREFLKEIDGTNTIWVESEEDKGDYKAIDVEYGECVQWNGANLTHGNKQNLTNTTRVSVDFRIIPFSKYKPSNHGSINTKTKFEIGGYYDKV